MHKRNGFAYLLKYIYILLYSSFKPVQSENRRSTKAQYFVNYTRAVQRGLIKGLSTYNVLENPIYKEAFAITWKFAVANNTVRSVRKLKRKAHVDADEDDAGKVEALRRGSILESDRKRKQSTKSNDAVRYSYSRNRNFYGSGSFACPVTPTTPSAPRYRQVPGDIV